MGSINAQVAGQKVIEKVRKGEKVVLGKILKDIGYSDGISKQPSRITSQPSYQIALELEKRPLIEGLQREISRIKDAMASKNLRKEEYRTLVGSLDVVTRNYQLLSGGATQRQVFVLPSEIMNKNQIQQSTNDVNSFDGHVEPPITP